MVDIGLRTEEGGGWRAVEITLIVRVVLSRQEERREGGRGSKVSLW